MKLIHFSFLLLLLAGFTSCGSDDDAPAPAELEGNWTALTLEATVNSTVTSPNINSVATTQISGTTFDYDLEFTGTEFTADGSYTIAISTDLDGTTSSSTDTYTSVDNTGSYTASSNEITFNGSLFSLEFNGMTIGGMGGAQTSDYSISGDILTISQDETTNSTTGDFTTSSTVVSTSTWRRN